MLKDRVVLELCQLDVEEVPRIVDLVMRYHLRNGKLRLVQVEDPFLMLSQLVDAHLVEVPHPCVQTTAFLALPSCGWSLRHSRHGPSSLAEQHLPLLLVLDSLIDFVLPGDSQVESTVDLLIVGLIHLLHQPLPLLDLLPFSSLLDEGIRHQI